jgi:hypothetical protein
VLSAAEITNSSRLQNPAGSSQGSSTEQPQPPPTSPPSATCWPVASFQVLLPPCSTLPRTWEAPLLPLSGGAGPWLMSDLAHCPLQWAVKWDVSRGALGGEGCAGPEHRVSHRLTPWPVSTGTGQGHPREGVQRCLSSNQCIVEAVYGSGVGGEVMDHAWGRSSGRAQCPLQHSETHSDLTWSQSSQYTACKDLVYSNTQEQLNVSVTTL